MRKVNEILICLLAAYGLANLNSLISLLRSVWATTFGGLLVFGIAGWMLGRFYREPRLLAAFFLGVAIHYSRIFVIMRGIPQTIGMEVGVWAAAIVTGYLFAKKTWLHSGVFGAICIIAGVYLALPAVQAIQSRKNAIVLTGKNIETVWPVNAILKDAGAKRLSLASFRDSVTLLEFYFAACPPCKIKSLALEQLQNRIALLPARIIYVDCGSIDPYSKFLNESATHHAAVYDSAGILVKSWQVISFPTEFLVDRSGVIRSSSSGINIDSLPGYAEATANKIEALARN